MFTVKTRNIVVSIDVAAIIRASALLLVLFL